jgi:mycobactin peptide synthetase MbtE
MIFQNELMKSFRANCDRTAIEQNGKFLSYSALYKKANALTAELLKNKIAKGTMIGICAVDSADMIFSMIGIMNAGCVFVPIDLKLPDTRISVMAKDLDLKYLVSTGGSNITNRFRKTGVQQIINVAGCWNTSDEEVPLINYPQYNADDSIYVYFTSGTTGKPKGVTGVNASLLQFVQWEIAEFSVTYNSRFSQLISPYFDAFLRDVFVPLLAGGTICIPPGDEDFLAGGKLGTWIDESAINYIHCVPSVFRLINTGNISDKMFSSLNYIMLSGEKIIPAELKSWYDVFKSQIQLVNFYGATETTMIRAFTKYSPPTAPWQGYLLATR